MSRYFEVYESWKRDPEGFWAAAAADIDWIKPWDKVFDETQGEYGRWFAGALCNTAYNCLDRHVLNGRGSQNALIYDSPVTGRKRIYNYRELLDEVATCAAVLARQGVIKGDRVILYMPMIPEAVIGMLACARLGAIHSVVFGGFAANELATRINDAKPKAILSASCGIEPNRIVKYKPLLDHAIEHERVQAGVLHHLPAPGRTRRACPGPRFRLGGADGRSQRAGRQGRVRSGRGDRSALHPLHVRNHRASPRAWCATTADIWSHSSGP